MYESLYKTKLGRRFAAFMAKPCISRAAGRLMDSRLSALFIRPFVKKNGIDLSEALPVKYTSFNRFFTRKLKEGARPVIMDENALASPCDGLLTVYPVTSDGIFTVKGTPYTMETLLEDQSLADSFLGGTVLIFRLTPSHYHRYAFPDKGEIVSSRRIGGIFHTVRPEALKALPVFKTNTREYTILNTASFGRVLFMEVGATMVGRIKNTKTEGAFERGEEKGMFEFGGSTIILALEKDAFIPKDEFVSNTLKDTETPVRLGECVGLKDTHEKA